MKLLSHRGLLRACHALYWARQYQAGAADHNPELSQTVRNLVMPWTVSLPAMPLSAFPVTLAAQVTMAVVPQQAWRHGTAIVVRGYDETGRAGFMILEPGRLPLHSRAGTPGQAASQALQTRWPPVIGRTARPKSRFDAIGKSQPSRIDDVIASR